MRVAESRENVAPFEPEWEGFAIREISITAPQPAKVHANEVLCQILYFRRYKPSRSATPIARVSKRINRGLYCPGLVRSKL